MLIGDKIERDVQPEHVSDAATRRKQHPAQAIQTPGMMVSVWGCETSQNDRYTPYFSPKSLNFDGEANGMLHRVGLVSHRGHKPEQPNQDDFFVLSRSESLLFGVLDGHGPEGHDISHFVQEKLPMYIMERLRQNEVWTEAVRGAASQVSEYLAEEQRRAAHYSGTTATVLMLGHCESSPSVMYSLRCAYLGDSLAVRAQRRSRSSQWEVTVLTDAHRPDREDERSRIADMGGKVDLSPGPGVPARLITPEWKIAMSRSFGDLHAERYGLSHEIEFAPECTIEKDCETFILVCSDGVWDVMPPAQAVSLVGKFKPEEAQLAAERLVSKSQRRWQEADDVVDDITAIVVWPSSFEDISPGIATACPSAKENMMHSKSKSEASF